MSVMSAKSAAVAEDILQNFMVPSEAQVDKKSADHYRITLSPFETGYAYTIGTAMRRILLSSMPGYAITEAEIPGVEHPFSVIDGVQEDVINILLNLKSVRLSTHTDVESVRLAAEVKGPCVLKAGDFKADHDVRMVNPDAVIAHINEARTFKLDCVARRGVGYGREEINAGDSDASDLPGVLRIDGATFSPIRKVAYEVENARVGNRTDLDKLILDIETDGTLSPEEAIQRCATILQHQLSAFSQFVGTDADEGERVAGDVNPILSERVESLELTVRAANCLRAENLIYVADLVACSEQDLMRTPNLGRKSLNEIKEALANHGLSLGHDISGWQRPKDEDEV